MKMYLLNHYRNELELEGFKTIGIFSCEKEAEKATEQLKFKPGFKEYPDNFHIDAYIVDKVFWVDGFG